MRGAAAASLLLFFFAHANAQPQIDSMYQLQGARTVAILEINPGPGNNGLSPFPRTSSVIPNGGSAFVWQQDSFVWWLQGYLALNVYGIACNAPAYSEFRPRNTTVGACPGGITGEVSVKQPNIISRGSDKLVVPFAVLLQQSRTGGELRDLCMTRNDIERLKYAASQFSFVDIQFSCDVSKLESSRDNFVGCTCTPPPAEFSWKAYWSDIEHIFAPIFVGFGFAIALALPVWLIWHFRTREQRSLDRAQLAAIRGKKQDFAAGMGLFRL